MALLKFFLFWCCATGTATAAAFSLGPRLPMVARHAGRSMGMGFNYFKILLKLMTPQAEEANLILSQYRQGSQQAHAFTREFKSSL